MLRPRGDLAQLVAALRRRFYSIIPSQLHLERSSLIETLENAGDLKLVVFIHDILPSLFPHYFTEEDADLYHRRMENAARLTDTIIVNSESTAEAFKSCFGESSTASALVIAPLGVAPPARIETPPCFSRKNHKLILELWRELQADLGASAPRLLVIGEYGWKGEDVIALLERSTPHGIVKVYGRLSDAAIAGLLKGARSLLLPSFAEDYGLPLAEALTLGTPPCFAATFPRFERSAATSRTISIRPIPWLGVVTCSTMPRPDPHNARPSFEDSLFGRGPPATAISQ